MAEFHSASCWGEEPDFSPTPEWVNNLAWSSDEADRVQAWYLICEHLLEGCRELVAHGEAEFLVGMHQDACEPETLAFLRYFYHHDASTRGLELDPTRLQVSLVGVIAAARVALLSKHPDPDRLAPLVLEAVEAWHRFGLPDVPEVDRAESSLPPSPDQTVPDWENDPLPVLRDCFHLLAKQGRRVGAVRDCVYWFLDQTRPVVRSRTLPVLATANRQGVVSWLRVELVANGSGDLYPHPLVMAFQPMTASFLESVRCAWRAASLQEEGKLAPQFDLRWSLPGQQFGVLEGGSLGAALAVAFTQVVRDRLLDPSCVLTARINEHGRLGSVGEVRTKALAAFSYCGPEGERINRMIVRPSNERDAVRGASAANRDLDLNSCVVTASTLAEACLAALGPSGSVCEYLQKLCHLADDNPMPYLGERKLHAIYVWPDVVSVADDRLMSWQEEQTLLAAKPPARLILLAPPGQGKSTLARMDASRLALTASQDLADNPDALAGVCLPLVLPLPLLAHFSAFAPAGELGLRNAIRSTLVKQGCLTAAAEYLADQAHQPRCWLYLDGLDEVPANVDLQRMLAPLCRWQCNVIVTSRPYGYYQHTLPFAVAEFQLAPFTEAATGEFLERWFESSSKKEQVVRWLEQTSVWPMSTNPFLLSLLCWVAERVPEFQSWTCPHLYQRFLCDLLEVPPDGSGQINPLRGISWLGVLRQVVLEEFKQHAGKEPLAYERLLNTLERSEQRPCVVGMELDELASQSARTQAELLIAELEKKRVLTPHGVTKAQWEFPHRSIAEFLAASALAETLNAASESESAETWKLVETKSWDRDWERVMQFLAGLLCDTRSFLKRLLKKEDDDLFRHRLCLAALCLAELPPASHHDLADDITTQVFWLWVEHRAEGTLAAVPRLEEAFRVLQRINAQVHPCEESPLMPRDALLREAFVRPEAKRVGFPEPLPLETARRWAENAVPALALVPQESPEQSAPLPTCPTVAQVKELVRLLVHPKQQTRQHAANQLGTVIAQTRFRVFLRSPKWARPAQWLFHLVPAMWTLEVAEM